MGAKTGIEWTDATWSPVRVRVRSDAVQITRLNGYSSLADIAEKMRGRVGQHCEHVSPGCEHCYAGTNNHRCLPGNGTGLPYDRRSRDLVEAFVDEKVILQPLKWYGVLDSSIPTIDLPRPRRIFVENQSDLFGEWVTNEMIDRVFHIMALCPQHIFQVLTKRPERMEQYFGRDNPVHFPLPNVWLGVSVENQATADERIPLLLQTPAAVRFISAEPLLAPVDLLKTEYLALKTSRLKYPFPFLPDEYRTKLLHLLNWVICGGESGPGARPMHPDWARSLRDQCAAAGVPFFMKQMGSTYGPSKGHELPDDLNIKQFPKAGQ